jgi:hypothetical protein
MNAGGQAIGVAAEAFLLALAPAALDAWLHAIAGSKTATTPLCPGPAPAPGRDGNYLTPRPS